MEWLYKIVTICIFILLLLVFKYKNKSFFLSSIYTLIIVLPFNITAQIFKNISDPYVNGIFTNYLQPYIHILDIFVIIFLISSLTEKRFRYKHIKKFFFPISLLLIYGILQYIFKEDIVILTNIFRLVTYLIAFKILSINIKDIKFSPLFIYILIATIIFQIVLGIFQFSNGTSIGLSMLGESQVVNGMRGSSFVSLKGTDYLRAYGTFPHPNVFGIYLVSMLFFFEYLLRKKYLKKYIFYLTIFVIIIGLGITFSRTAWVCSGIFLIYLISKNFKKGNLNSFIPIFLERLNIFGTSFDERVTLLKSSWGIFKENIFFGTGLGRFVDSFGEDIPRTVRGIPLIEPVHNVIALMFCELGVVGGLLLVWSWLCVVKDYIFNFKRNRFLKVSLLLCILFIWFIDHFFFSLPQGYVLQGLLFILFMS